MALSVSLDPSPLLARAGTILPSSLIAAQIRVVLTFDGVVSSMVAANDKYLSRRAGMLITDTSGELIEPTDANAKGYIAMPYYDWFFSNKSFFMVLQNAIDGESVGANIPTYWAVLRASIKAAAQDWGTNYPVLSIVREMADGDRIANVGITDSGSRMLTNVNHGLTSSGGALWHSAYLDNEADRNWDSKAFHVSDTADLLSQNTATAAGRLGKMFSDFMGLTYTYQNEIEGYDDFGSTATLPSIVSDIAAASYLFIEFLRDVVNPYTSRSDKFISDDFYSQLQTIYSNQLS
jgi:hypothetical protein